MRRYIERLLFGIVFITPFILILLPADYFDSGKSICLSVRLAGIKCYACGLTRAIMHLLHLELNTAWLYNKLSFLILPLGIPFWLRSIYEVLDKKIPNVLRRLS